MTEPRLTTEQLGVLADAAFTVLNWAKRQGLNREQQITEVVRTFEVALGYREPVIQYGKAAWGKSYSAAEVAEKISRGEPL